MFYKASEFVKAPNLIVLLIMISAIETIRFIFGGNVVIVMLCFEAAFFPF